MLFSWAWNCWLYPRTVFRAPQASSKSSEARPTAKVLSLLAPKHFLSRIHHYSLIRASSLVGPRIAYHQFQKTETLNRFSKSFSMCYVSLNWDDRIDVTSLFGRVVHPVNSSAIQSGFQSSDRSVLLKNYHCEVVFVLRASRYGSLESLFLSCSSFFAYLVFSRQAGMTGFPRRVSNKCPIHPIDLICSVGCIINMSLEMAN